MNRTYSGVRGSPRQPRLAGQSTRLATGVHSYSSVCHIFSLYILVISNLHQPIHEAQIYFVFLSVGNPKTVLKGGYSGWLCKLFDKALVVALARGALAMCLQIGLVKSHFSNIFLLLTVHNTQYLPEILEIIIHHHFSLLRDPCQLSSQQI